MDAAKRFRLGLTAKSVIVTSLAVLLAVGTYVLTSRAFDRLNEGLDRLTTTQLEQLMTSVRLVQRAESLVTLGSSLAQASSHDERRRAVLELNERTGWMRKASADLTHVVAEPDMLERIQAAQQQLGETIRRLDERVRDRIDGERGAANDKGIRELTDVYRETARELNVLMGYVATTTRRTLTEASAQLTRETRIQQRNLLVVSSMLLLFVVFVGLYFELRVVRRLLYLQRNVAADDVDPTQLVLKGDDELAELSTAVSSYARRIQAQEARMKQINGELAFLAEHDPLTQLANRRHFDVAAGRLLQLATMPLCVALGDIDHFKRINDEFGHATGDRALVQVARLLKAGLRANDVAARLGGEEFVAVFPVHHGQEAHDILERIRRAIATQSIEAEGSAPTMLTISFGVALVEGLPLALTAASSEVQRLLAAALRAADEALYEAKRGGRNRICFAPAIVRPDPDPPDRASDEN